MTGYEQSPDYGTGPSNGFWTAMVVLALCIATLIYLSWPSAEAQITKYTDGDTVWIDGVKYRLHGIDAPEPRKDNAKCEAEITLGLAASQYIEDITANARIEVTHSYGADIYDRVVADISIDGRDWGEWLIAEGYAVAWDYDGGEPKPDWCE